MKGLLSAIFWVLLLTWAGIKPEAWSVILVISLAILGLLFERSERS